MELFVETELIAYVPTHFAPSYTPFATIRQIMREIISARYPTRKIAKAAITWSAPLNAKAKAIPTASSVSKNT
jgi:hypothetical protein